MKLRKKSFLFVAGALVAVTAAMLGVFHFVAVRGFERIENHDALQTVRRVQNLVQAELDELGRATRDLATWDQLRRATEGEDRSFLEKQAGYAGSRLLRWSAFTLLGDDGRVLIAQDLRSPAGSRELPAADLATLAAMARAYGGARSEQHFALLSGTPCMVVLSPVRPMSAGLPRAGLLIAVRHLDATELERTARLADRRVRLLPLTQVTDEAQPLTAATAPWIRRSSASEVIGRAVLVGWDGQPVGVLEAALDPVIRESGLRVIIILMVVVIIGELLTLALIDRFILRDFTGRLLQLGTLLCRVRRSEDLRQRLPIAGKDEISGLVIEINQLLDSVESSHRTLERVNAEMQQRVAERTAALAEANAALEADIAERIKAEQEREGLREQLLRSQKMEAVGTLAGGIAHDFNNILAGILGHAQLVGSDISADHPAQTHVRQVITAADRAAALVRQILAFSRQTPGERRAVSVGQIAREALSLLRAALPANIQIRCNVEAANDMVYADPTQLHQVIMNLGTNAGHAIGSREGALTIRVSQLSPKERLGATNPIPSGDYVCIEVKDTGCGMTPEVMARIFDPFFSTKPVNEGTGLGLAVVHGIVTDHGGSIRVESEPGKGTVFRVVLPLIDARASESMSRHAMPLRGTEKVLVVDDEEIVLSVIAKSLERLGYAVTAELSSVKALALFKASPDSFDLVITDQTMPQMSGLELAESIKSLRPSLPVILVTGFSPDVSGKDARALGVAAVVGKPIQLPELTAIMRVELSMVAKPPSAAN